MGEPQDIEWAFEGQQLWLLQARPITTALREAPIADETLLVFDNSNIVESYPGLVSPLTYSFAQYAYSRVYRAFVRVVGVSQSTVRDNAAVFDNMLSRIDGRVYYNLGNWYRAGAAARLCHQSRLYGNHDGRQRTAAGGIRCEHGGRQATRPRHDRRMAAGGGCRPATGPGRALA
ncbi:hypothetical protein N8D56_20200 [Devosia sp. A8/3-2]|nr:hypothetical protein N8D56_20200 [Devosia sp. A8/3-2]